MSRLGRLAPILLAIAVTVPGLCVRITATPLPAPFLALIAGTAILGASFLLLWACDAVQVDVSQTLALALVAIIAVLPECAVDMYFTWQAGVHPAAGYARFAGANMTGANRMLIGVAWAVIVAIFWLRTRRPVRIEKERRLELLFLGLATLYAFVIPLKGTLTLFDGVVFLGLYGRYITLAGRRPCEGCEVEGPAEVLARMPALQRRVGTAALFLFAALVIGLNAEPFCEGLVGTGKTFGINEFFLVQWLAPLASEAPEFIVAVAFAMRGQAGPALGSLLSAKLNQWTLLVGMIPCVYAVAHRGIGTPIPMDPTQMHEILLTAAQSLLGVVLLSMLRLSIWHALLLFGLFSAQLVAPPLLAYAPGFFPAGLTGDRIHQVFSLLYIAAALTVAADSPRRVWTLWRGAFDDVVHPARSLARPAQTCAGHIPAWLPGAGPEPAHAPGHGPNCGRCPFREASSLARSLEESVR